MSYERFQNKFVFILGREQGIALAELKSVFTRFDIDADIYKITGNLVFANIDNFTKDDARELSDVLGGTMKIYQILIQNLYDHPIIGILKQLLHEEKKGSEHKINFGISEYSEKFSIREINEIGIKIKIYLKKELKLRFVGLQDSLELSSIVSLKNKLIGNGLEFGLFSEGIGVLVGLSNAEEWSIRDYEKPAYDKFSGMVPPKLARAMVNLAIGQAAQSRREGLQMLNVKCLMSNVKTGNIDSVESHPELACRELSRTVLGSIEDIGSVNENCKLKIENCSHAPNHLVIDPFCGSGNILMEAMLLGCDVLGSDISPKAVADSTKNIEWARETYGHLATIKSKISNVDATEEDFFADYEKKASDYDTIAIVGEPYLGEPKKFKPTYNAARGEYGKVKALSLGFLENLAPHLKRFLAGENKEDVELAENIVSNQPRNIICLVFPLVETLDRGQFSLFLESVDEIRKLGYTQVRNSFIYGREYQVVKREIILLKLT